MLDRVEHGPYNPRMFGLSFPKLLLLALVVAAVWYGFKHMQARDRQPAAARRVREPASSPDRAVTVTEDLVKCPVCATYVARAARACDRPDCPQARGAP
ncbi:MAG TPA: hypothetical protein VMB81_18165 [Candidatus Sulfotelmatobacter sp.]|nr:hypothetical protein [Candidatus Sulfotelmatobacter sp.]